MVKVRNSTISSQFKQFSIRIHFKASYIILVGGERVITEESCPNQIKTQEKEGGGEAKVKVYACDEEAKQSTTVHDKGQTGWMNSKGVPRDEIAASDSKVATSVNIKQMMVNLHERGYHEKVRSRKHAMWASKSLNVSST